MRYLCFETEGLIDFSSITTFGLNVKPKTSNPIGYFGTGLKYAIAVLARMGSKVTFMIDGISYEFFAKDFDFRGKTFQKIRMRKRHGLTRKFTYKELPFTTEYGKNWEPWQVFRELESNTRDEKGSTFLIDEDSPEGMSYLNDENHHRGKTIIMVSDEKVIQSYFDRDKIFLPESLKMRVGTESIQVLNAPSNHIYYRGLRVADLPIPSTFTYNILSSLELTEDRTVKYMFVVDWHVRDFIMGSDDLEYLNSIFDVPKDKSYESKLDFEGFSGQPSLTFLGIIGDRRSYGKNLWNRIGSYYSTYYPPEKSDPEIAKTFRRSFWKKIKVFGQTINDNPEVLREITEKLDSENRSDCLTAFQSLLDQI